MHGNVGLDNSNTNKLPDAEEPRLRVPLAEIEPFREAIRKCKGSGRVLKGLRPSGTYRSTAPDNPSTYTLESLLTLD